MNAHVGSWRFRRENVQVPSCHEHSINSMCHLSTIFFNEHNPNIKMCLTFIISVSAIENFYLFIYFTFLTFWSTEPIYFWITKVWIKPIQFKWLVENKNNYKTSITNMKTSIMVYFHHCKKKKLWTPTTQVCFTDPTLRAAALNITNKLFWRTMKWKWKRNTHQSGN